MSVCMYGYSVVVEKSKSECLKPHIPKAWQPNFPRVENATQRKKVVASAGVLFRAFEL